MRNSASSLGCVAALAATAMFIPAAAQQPTTATKVIPVGTAQALPDFPGHEVVILLLDMPPGAPSTPPHRHPGIHAFGYVLEGSYKFKLGQGPETVLTKGQTFYEPPGELHAVSANASQTEPAKVLVFSVAPSGKPLLVMEKP